MVDLIFRYCAIAAIFIACLCIYTVLVSRVLPGFFLSPVRGSVLNDRGVRKCVFPGGRSVTYEPKLGIRKYVSQYVLFTKDGEKYIKCKVNEKVRNVKYELVIYDRKDKVTGVLEIAENVKTEGYTSEVLLPPETSYVHLQLLTVNGTAIKGKESEIYKGKDAVIFLVSVFALTFIEGLFMNYVILETCSLFLGYFRFVPEVNIMPVILVVLATSVLVAIVLFVLNIARPFKLVWNKKRKTEKK